ncbi:RagB/SusD family nutrient uptake outer membrane protein [Chitinophaga parva]|uniref:RagB/SusD family nutrient uptake outer membrane protein n=1 Tax=Chitinophaga parva TaxID=2169414 RepID=A0A2T7BEN2_9BACT|nr:RagB/SusD family nutrient uptake outer membrane protein [Chitinophaga parva]PUZ24749.1 RagB/SusD family nutrient uptake outer membrane protein [Chitinophaga parva]
MKHQLKIAAGLVLLLCSCSKFLDRQPLSAISPANGFNTENELQLYVHSFYDPMFPNADNDNNGFTSLYNEDIDNMVKNSVADNVYGTRTVPNSAADGNWKWTNLRNINYFLANYTRGGIDTSIANKYAGQAHFFRAYFYTNMVQRFGDVPWYSTYLDISDTTQMTRPRDPRTLVMDSVLVDIDYAIAHLPATKDPGEVTKYTALALKARLCLFEGTFRKYHREFNLPDADRFLSQAADAAQTLMNLNVYKIYRTTAAVSYRDLFASLTPVTDEVILYRQYSNSLQKFHNVNYYTLTPSYGKPGMEKRLVNSYLMKDGSRFTDKPGYATMQFYDECQNRDPRLAQTIRTPGYKRINSTLTVPPMYNGTMTGYQIVKYVTSTADDAYTRNYNPLSIFRYGEVLLVYAEAKAELGTLTQDDVNKSIKLLRDRVDMPNLDLAAANANPDPYLASQYTNVTGANKGVILEIRRERRIELVMEGFRWNDLMRWKEGHLLTDVFKGAYFPGTGNYDLDGDGKVDLVIYTGTQPSGSGPQYLKLGTDIVLENGESGGNITVNANIPKKFREDRDYLYPIPTQELLLNQNLKQNPNWNQ